MRRSDVQWEQELGRAVEEGRRFGGEGCRGGHHALLPAATQAATQGRSFRRLECKGDAGRNC